MSQILWSGREPRTVGRVRAFSQAFVYKGLVKHNLVTPGRIARRGFRSAS